MLELRPSQATVVHCLGRPAALGAMRPIESCGAYRVAPGELILVGYGPGRAGVRDAAEAALCTAEPGSLVVDMSDGWVILSVTGLGFEATLTRLSAIAPPSSPPAFLQGAIAEVPAKAIVLSSAIHVMVATTVEHHLRERISSACADLGVRDLPPAPLEGPLT